MADQWGRKIWEAITEGAITPDQNTSDLKEAAYDRRDEDGIEVPGIPGETPPPETSFHQKTHDNILNIKSSTDLYAPGAYASIGHVAGVTPRTINSSNSGLNPQTTPENIIRAGGTYKGHHAKDSFRWDIQGASYTGETLNVTARGFLVTSIFFKPNGLTFYIVEDTNNRIDQYECSTAWDISTGVYSGKTLSVVAQDGKPTGMFFKSNGRDMFLVGSNSDAVFRWSLAVAWDITTAIFVLADSFSVAAQENIPQSIFFKPDGLTFYIIGAGSDTVYQYTLTTPWLTRTAAYSGKSFNVTGIENAPVEMFFKYDGTKFFVIGQQTGEIHLFQCATPWDIDTAFNGNISFDVGGEFTTGKPTGMFFKPNGLAFYVIGEIFTTAHIFNYTLENDQLVLPFTPNIRSTNLNDTVAGTGARTVSIRGLDSNFNSQSEVIAMDGTTPVASQLQWVRVEHSEVITSGSNPANLGSILVKSAIDSLVTYIAILNQENTGTILGFTVPEGKSVLFVDYGINHCSVDNVAPTEFSYGEIELQYLGFEKEFYIPIHITLSRMNGQPVRERLTGILIREKSSVIMEVKRVGSASQIGGFINYVEIDNDLIDMDTANYFPS